MVPFAEAITHSFGAREVALMWENNKNKILQKSNLKVKEIHALITSLLVISTESTSDNLAEGRRACGGLGLSKFAGFSFRMNDHEIQSSWEGDSHVLGQQAAKYLLNLLSAKTQGKWIISKTCSEWINNESVKEDKFELNSAEEITSVVLEKAIEHRIN